MHLALKKIGENITFHVDVEPTDTIRVLKDKVRAQLRGVLDSDRIQLMYGGEILIDHRTLNDYHIDGRFFLGVEIFSAPGRSVTLTTHQMQGASAKAAALPSVSIRDDPVNKSEIQVVEGEPDTDDMFEIYRYLTMKYHRWSGLREPLKENRRYLASWSFTANELADVDKLFAMGFRRSMVVQAYAACGKDLNRAANFLAQDSKD